MSHPLDAIYQPQHMDAPTKVEVDKDVLFFDLETVPDWDRAMAIGIERVGDPPPIDKPDGLPPFETVLTRTVPGIRETLEGINPPQEWLDGLEQAERRDKSRAGVIDAIKKVKDRQQKGIEAKDGQLKFLATCTDLNRIVAYGFAFDGGQVGSLVVGDDDTTERKILECFWHDVQRARTLAGYHILGFDLPTVLVRSAELGIKPTRKFDLRPWSTDVIDLYAKRYGGHQPSGYPGKLKQQAQLYGIQVPAGVDMDGSQVADLIDQGDFHSVHRYVQSDVEILRPLYERWDGLFF